MGGLYEAGGAVVKGVITVVAFFTGSKVKERATKTVLKGAANVVHEDIVPACRDARGLSQSHLLRFGRIIRHVNKCFKSLYR